LKAGFGDPHVLPPIWLIEQGSDMALRTPDGELLEPKSHMYKRVKGPIILTQHGFSRDAQKQSPLNLNTSHQQAHLRVRHSCVTLNQTFLQAFNQSLHNVVGDERNHLCPSLEFEELFIVSLKISSFSI
jgi:hypothetical protein